MKIKSLKDAGYKGATLSENLSIIAGYCLDKDSDFWNEPKAETVAELKEGQMLRKAELYGTKLFYVNDSGDYIAVDKAVQGKENIKFTVDFAMSFTPNEVAKMKSDNPRLYALVTPLRKEVNTYCSNRTGDLKRKAKEIYNKRNNIVTTRAVVSFKEYIDDTLSKMKDRCKSAKAKNEEFADEAKMKQAIKAFTDVMFK